MVKYYSVTAIFYLCGSPDSDPCNRGEPVDDALRFFISEAEELFFLLLTIYSKYVHSLDWAYSDYVPLWAGYTASHIGMVNLADV